MSTPVRASDRDLRALAAIVSQDRPDLPDGEGLPSSLLADLKDQIRCDEISLDRYDSGRQAYWFLQSIPALSDDELQASKDPPGALGALLGLPLGLPVLQLSRAHRRPARRRQTL